MEYDLIYEAFISYRHCELDMYIARRLHKMLETYQVPDKLKNVNKHRKTRIFRDQEELPLASNLSESIETALWHSGYLLLICSTATPQSMWVTKEVETFLTSGRADRILVLLLEGNIYTSVTGILHSYIYNNQIAGIIDVSGYNNRSEKWKALKREKLQIISRLVHASYDSIRNYHWKRRISYALSLGIVINLLLISVGIYSYKRLQLAESARKMAEQENTITMNVMNDLIFNLPYLIKDYPGGMQIASDVLDENTPILNTLLDSGFRKEYAAYQKSLNFKMAANAYVDLGSSDQAEQGYEDAIDILTSLQKNQKFFDSSYSYLQVTEFQMGQLLERHLAECYTGLSKTSLAQGDMDKASRYLTKALDINRSLYQSMENDPDYIYSLAESYCLTGDLLLPQFKPEEAIEQYKEAVKLLKALPVNYDLEKAALLIEKTYYSLSSAEAELSNGEAAMEDITQAINALDSQGFTVQKQEAEVGYVDCYTQYATLLGEEEKYEEAISYYRKALDINQKLLDNLGLYRYMADNVDIKNNMSELYLMTGKFSEAARVLEENIQLMENSAQYQEDLYGKQQLSLTYGYLANVCLMQEDLRQAEKYYGKALDLSVENAKNSNDVIVWVSLAMNYSAYGKILGFENRSVEAEENFDHAIYIIKTISENNAIDTFNGYLKEMYLQLALTRMIAGDYELSLDALTEAGKLENDSSVNDAYRVAAYLLSGEGEEAKEILSAYRISQRPQLLQDIRSVLESVQQYSNAVIDVEYELDQLK